MNKEGAVKPLFDKKEWKAIIHEKKLYWLSAWQHPVTKKIIYTYPSKKSFQRMEKEKEYSVGSKMIVLYHVEHSNSDIITVPKYNVGLAVVPYNEEERIIILQ